MLRTALKNLTGKDEWEGVQYLESKVVLHVDGDGRAHPVDLAAHGFHVAEEQCKLPLGVCDHMTNDESKNKSIVCSYCTVYKSVQIHTPLHPESTSIPITCRTRKKHMQSSSEHHTQHLPRCHPHPAAAAAAAAVQQQAVVLQASAQMHMHDVVFHVIFGSDSQGVLDFVLASAVRLHSITHCPFLSSMMNSVLAHSSSSVSSAIGPDVIKALFFLLLNVDMVLKEYVCTPGCVKAFAAAMNIASSSAATYAKKAATAANGSLESKRRKLLSNTKTDAEKECLMRMHAWSMMGTRPMDPAKARRFFTVLHDSIVKMWLQDERLHASDLVQMVKEEYLVC